MGLLLTYALQGGALQRACDSVPDMHLTLAAALYCACIGAFAVYKLGVGALRRHCCCGNLAVVCVCLGDAFRNSHLLRWSRCTASTDVPPVTCMLHLLSLLSRNSRLQITAATSMTLRVGSMAEQTFNAVERVQVRHSGCHTTSSLRLTVLTSTCFS